jgi:hypothetical protein
MYESGLAGHSAALAFRQAPESEPVRTSMKEAENYSYLLLFIHLFLHPSHHFDSLTYNNHTIKLLSISPPNAKVTQTTPSAKSDIILVITQI